MKTDKTKDSSVILSFNSQRFYIVVCCIIYEKLKGNQVQYTKKKNIVYRHDIFFICKDGEIN